jgi:hypothetical protein
MKTELTFGEVCNFIKEDNPKLLEDVDKLLGFALILAPFVLFPSPLSVAPALGLLGIKSELTGIGKRLYEKLTAKKDKDPLAKQQRMEAAYGLICFTAFFDAIDVQLPEIFGYIGMNDVDKTALVEAAIEKLTARKGCDGPPAEETDSRLEALKVVMPHPVDSFGQQRSQLLPLYQEMTKGFTTFLEWLPLWEKTNEETRGKVAAMTQKLPEKALELFDAQYYALAAKYEEFFIWSNLQEHKKTRAALKRQMSGYLKKHVALAKSEQKTIDLGFAKLADAVAAIPDHVAAYQAGKVFEELGRGYVEIIDQPVFKDKYVTPNNQPAITYPKKSAIFVPQSFKAIHYTGNQHLEDEATWRDVPSRNDLGAFLLNYLSSPYSTLAPLMILGHPGSGKSLLTHILSARLISPLCTPIRVELRDINADSDIDIQIEQQIRKDTGRPEPWANLSDHLDSRPALVILDGYDELLQASGKVFSGYLLKVQKFQEREANIRRPVRAIITSRITLIDKAAIPEGATVVRLEEFDEDKRNKWTSIWNAANQQYFRQTGYEPFELPKEDKNIIPLAEQPLLLLMLAIYDSEENQLRKSKGLDQTRLYYSLIRRFIERERMKSQQFEDPKLKPKVLDEEIEKDMERLGLAALGMFNRRSLYIHADQLNADLKFFQIERVVQDSDGVKMSQADLLLGSFFFVHKAKSARADGVKIVDEGTDGDDERATKDDSEAAFEFLHNTFGEFLAADFILRKILFATSRLSKLNADAELRSVLLEILKDPNGLKEIWYASLMYTPLYSRPVILDMMREWLRHRLAAAKRTPEDFLAGLDIIVPNEIERVLVSNKLPPVMTENNKTSFDDLPLVGHLATYSLNLILLRTILSSDGYTFDESKIIPVGEKQVVPVKDSVRAWDRLTYLWRSWFSLESLNELTAILTAKRDGAEIALTAKPNFTTSASNNRLDSILNVSLALADNITAGMTGLFMYSPFGRDERIDLADVGERLRSERVDLELELSVRRLGDMLRFNSSPQDAVMMLEHFTYLFTNSERPRPDLFLAIVQYAKEIRMDEDDDGYYAYRFLFRLLEYSLFERHFELMPAAVLDLIRLIKHVGYGDRYGGRKELYYLLGKMLEHSDSPYLYNRSPELFIEMQQITRGMEEREYIRRAPQDIVHSKWVRNLSLESTVKLLGLVQESGDRGFIKHFTEDVCRHLSRPRRPGRRTEYPRVIIEFLELVRENIDENSLARIARELFMMATDEEFTVIESPAATVKLILFMREIGLYSVVKEHGADLPRYIARVQFLSRVPVEQVAGVIRMLREDGNIKPLDDWYGTLRHRPEVERWPPQFTIEFVRLARDFGDEEFLQRFFNVTPAHSKAGADNQVNGALGFYDGRTKLNLGALPLDALLDLYRMAEKYNSVPTIEGIKKMVAFS